MIVLTRLRAPRSVAFSALKNSIGWIVKHLKPRPRGLHVRRIDDHLARDIGLSGADLARHRLTLPSQTEHHPRG